MSGKALLILYASLSSRASAYWLSALILHFICATNVSAGIIVADCSRIERRSVRGISRGEINAQERWRKT
jgi:hypothetical protein